MKLTLLTTTIFLPTLLDMLGSIKVFPDQTICVINRVSQRDPKLSPEVRQQMQEVEAQAREKYPFIEFPEVTDTANWKSINQQFNIGLKHSRNDYCAIAHDDILYHPRYDYFGAFAEALELIPEAEAQIGKRVIGLNFSALEGVSRVVSPVALETPMIWMPFPPTSAIVDRRAVFEAGGFDEEWGIWYDAQFQQEMLKRKWFMLYVPVPTAMHKSGTSFGLTSYPEKFHGCNEKVNYFYGEIKPAAEGYAVSPALGEKLRGIVERHGG